MLFERFSAFSIFIQILVEVSNYLAFIKLLTDFLFRYASDHAIDTYKGYCQKKLLQCENIESQLARTYPPSHLEWKATTRCANLALEAKYSDRKQILFIL